MSSQDEPEKKEEEYSRAKSAEEERKAER